MKKDITSTAAYTRMEFRLSESNPIRILDNSYDRTFSTPFLDMHYEFEIGYLRKGRMLRHLRGSSFECGRGEFWFCGIWEPHGIRISQAPCNAIVFVVWPPLIANMFFPEAPGISPMSLFAGSARAFRPSGAKKSAELARLVEDIFGLEGREEPICAARKRIAFSDLCLRLIEELPPESRRIRGNNPFGAYSAVSPAIDLVFASRQPVSNTAAAELCAMSEDKFIRLFGHLMGISFAEFARRHRLLNAANAIAATDSPIKDICREWGFTDQSHLHRLFQRYYSCSPAEYRRLKGLNYG